MGEDALGRWVTETLRGDGIDVSGIFFDPAGTSRSINLVFADGSRKNFYDGKSHMTLEPDLDRLGAIVRRARLAHVHLPNWARHLLPIAREAGVTVACDLQDVRDPADPYRRDFVEAADFLFASAANHADDPGRLLDALDSPGRTVVLGLGVDGCRLRDADGTRHQPPPRFDGAPPIVDTNGAGDSLAVGFLAARVVQSLDADTALLQGQIAARHACAQRASSDSLVTRDELAEYVARLL